MRNSYEKIKKEVGEIKRLCDAELSVDHIADMSANTLQLVQSAMRLTAATMDFTEAQVATMERLEQKLDELLSKT